MRFLSDIQIQQLSEFPKISNNEMIKYYFLSEEDIAIIPKKSPSYSRLGFALLMCSTRFLGFNFVDFHNIPKCIIKFLAKQLSITDDTKKIFQYGLRSQTKTSHLKIIEKHLGFQRFSKINQDKIEEWLLEKALEHDGPIFLLKLLIKKLKADLIMRPSLSKLERVVLSVRNSAYRKTYDILCSNLPLEFYLEQLDDLLEVDPLIQKTKLSWLRHRCNTHSPESICISLEKIEFLKKMKVDSWNLSTLSSNRLKLLSNLGKRCTNQSLQRSSKIKRYSILISFLYQALKELNDEAFDLFDICLGKLYNKSKNDVINHQVKSAKLINNKVILCKIMGDILLNQNIAPDDIRGSLYKKITEEELQQEVFECDNLIRPKNDKYLDYFIKRFNYLRRFTPKFLNILEFKSFCQNDELLQAIEIIKNKNNTKAKKLPQNLPISFLTNMWLKYVYNKGEINYKFYELALLWELKNNVKAGNILLENSIKYNSLEQHLFSIEQANNVLKKEVDNFYINKGLDNILKQKEIEINNLYSTLNKQIKNKNNVRIENNRLIIPPLEATEKTDSIIKLKKMINKMLPRVSLPDILVEVDNWTKFSDHFHHLNHRQNNKYEFPIYLYAVILSEATNMGATAMSQVSNLDYEKIIWYKNWYIRDETLDTARTILVNFQNNLPFSQQFGDGKFSSSDGRRVPVAVKSKTAKSFVKYFGYETGVNLYSWTSDLFVQYGNRVTSPTMREATLVLDAILNNETDLNIERHTTDTAGYTEIIFALFDLLDIKFEPRIKNIADQRIYTLGVQENYKYINNLIHGPIRVFSNKGTKSCAVNSL